MTKQLKWRLGKLPTPDEVLKLVNDKLITKEEARDILFNEVDESKRDEESLKEEIKFLRELVAKLSNQSKIVETIRYIEKPYYNYGWYAPYVTYCSNTASLTGGNFTLTSATSGTTNANYTGLTSDSLNSSLASFTSGTGEWNSANDFAQISTF